MSGILSAKYQCHDTPLCFSHKTIDEIRMPPQFLTVSIPELPVLGRVMAEPVSQLR